MKIEKVYIACHKNDLRLTRICVASIRYWYPKIPIYLIKDRFNGDFSTAELESAWGVRDFETANRIFGWGMSKLEPVFNDKGSRFLVLDSDTVFTGRVLDRLEQYSEYFIVNCESQPAQRVKEIYFDLDELHAFDPRFVYLGNTFNTGQYVATGGILSHNDFAAVNWDTNPPSLKHSEVFRNGEQGVLNYVVMKKAAANELTVRSVPFMRWPGYGIDDIDTCNFNDASPYLSVVHWAGLTRPWISTMIRSDILGFFEDYYYSRMLMGLLLKGWRAMTQGVANMNARTKRRLFRSSIGSRTRTFDHPVTGPISSS
jgi:lipopolysaccharide biosynthesis glycosyltransferase